MSAKAPASEGWQPLQRKEESAGVERALTF
jgi:hypothetical protein